LAKKRLTKEEKLKGLQDFLNRAAKKLSKNRTTWESKIFKHLSDLHYKFQFQVPVIYNPTNGQKPKGYILDFLLTDYNIVIEIDGMWHSTKEQQKADKQRTKKLQKLGYEVIRFYNRQVSTFSKENIDQIIKSKIETLPVNKS